MYGRADEAESIATIQRACEGWLKRLGVETIDLFYQHGVDPNVPIEDTVGAMGRATLEHSMKATEVAFSAEDLAKLDEASPRGATAGPRHGERAMATTRL
ncbi:aryl-alcohol dehydrogenase-like predicted oxidoreductase [Sphingomonas sp. SORGH_AS 879]|nr:aldo/keto reductase [Sphingomonas sp. SORGH_AS_0879]MDQ1229141.1 aryl-alcohol dehydrogenase-like predicted oxidoreductase [Sphingomonas sp. SORGH_AS_0879]